MKISFFSCMKYFRDLTSPIQLFNIVSWKWLTCTVAVRRRLSSCPASPWSSAGVLQATGGTIIFLKTTFFSRHNYLTGEQKHLPLGDVPAAPGPVGVAAPAGDPRHALPQRLQREWAVQQGRLPLCCRQDWRRLWGVCGRGDFCPATIFFGTITICHPTGPKSGKPRKPWTLWRPSSPLQVQWLELAEMSTGESSK